MEYNQKYHEAIQRGIDRWLEDPEMKAALRKAQNECILETLFDYPGIPVKTVIVDNDDLRR